MNSKKFHFLQKKAGFFDFYFSLYFSTTLKIQAMRVGYKHGILESEKLNKLTSAKMNSNGDENEEAKK